MQDPTSFSEVTQVSATKAYEEAGVYRVDVSVTSSNVSKTGSIDVVVEGEFYGFSKDVLDFSFFRSCTYSLKRKWNKKWTFTNI